jgi:hypothetical protein
MMTNEILPHYLIIISLEIAAQKDHRSMSSLLEKIIIDYLDKEGISWTDAGSAPAKVGRPKKTAQKKQAT